MFQEIGTDQIEITKRYEEIKRRRMATETNEIL
jgi:hypothetical protein